MSPEILERYHAELEHVRPAGLVAYASALGHLAEHLLERGHTPHYPTRTLVTGAEKLLPAHREKIETAFGRPVHERYGSRDVGLIGFQLTPREHLSYTIDWANIFVEPENAEPNAPILITKLHADGMPMIRYRIGDAVCFRVDTHLDIPALSCPKCSVE